MSLEAELLALDEKFWVGGPEIYAEHCDDECLVVFADMAAVMAREDIAETAEKGRWTSVALTPIGLMRLSETAAVVAYQCEATRNDGQPYRALVSSGYRLRNDGWKLATHQQTEVETVA